MSLSIYNTIISAKSASDLLWKEDEDILTPSHFKLFSPTSFLSPLSMEETSVGRVQNPAIDLHKMNSISGITSYSVIDRSVNRSLDGLPAITSMSIRRTRNHASLQSYSTIFSTMFYYLTFSASRQKRRHSTPGRVSCNQRRNPYCTQIFVLRSNQYQYVDSYTRNFIITIYDSDSDNWILTCIFPSLCPCLMPTCWRWLKAESKHRKLQLAPIIYRHRLVHRYLKDNGVVLYASVLRLGIQYKLVGHTWL